MITEKEYQKEYELKNKEKIKNRKKIFYMEKGGKEKQNIILQNEWKYYVYIFINIIKIMDGLILWKTFTIFLFIFFY